MSSSYKFGKLISPGEQVEYRYEDSWSIEKTKGPDRLVIAPASGQVGVLLDLMQQLPEPFGLLYVLVVSRCDHALGRYQSPHPTNRKETVQFLETYHDYLEGDGRHHIWVMSLPANSTLVYDRHNVIYAYGPLADFQTKLETRGMIQSDVRFPDPHCHLYNQEFDEAESRLIKHWDWKYFPLQPSDEQ